MLLIFFLFFLHTKFAVNFEFAIPFEIECIKYIEKDSEKRRRKKKAATLAWHEWNITPHCQQLSMSSCTINKYQTIFTFSMCNSLWICKIDSTTKSNYFVCKKCIYIYIIFSLSLFLSTTFNNSFNMND